VPRFIFIPISQITAQHRSLRQSFVARLIGLLVVLGIVLTPTSAIAADSLPLRSEMPPDISRILQRGKLVVAILNNDNPPFFMSKENGQLNGLDVKIAQEIAEQLGVNLEFNRSAKTFDEVTDRVYKLDADIAISKLSRTLNRAKKVRFSSPYLTMQQGLLVNRLLLAQQTSKTRNVTLAIRNLSGKVGVIKGSSYVGFLKQKFPTAQIVEFPSWAETVAAVSNGKILAAYRDELEIKKVVLNKPNIALELQTIALTDTQDSIAIVLPWDSTHLLAFVNQLLETMESRYTVDSLLKEYFKR
jgi:polar amino acid transport system substrate-binding protein